MKINFDILLGKVFDNLLGRWYLKVPKGKKIYKITPVSVHYYTGEVAKDGLPVICSGGCNPGGERFVFNRVMRLAQVISFFALLPILPKSLFPLIALTDTGYKSPTATGTPDNSWTNPTNAYSSNDQYATLSTVTYKTTVPQSYSNFGFGLVGTETLVGIELSVEWYEDIVQGTLSFGLYLAVHGWASGKDVPDRTSEGTDVLGGASDLWGGTSSTRTPADFANDSGFYFNMLGKSTSGYTTNFYVDHIQVKIYYTSIVAPTVTTQAVTDKAQTTGTGNGNITDAGGENCTRRGFCYMAGTSGDPTTANSVAYDDGSFAAGAYTKGITGLTAGTAYRVRAYAVNSAGTGYGATVAYTTTFASTLTEVIKAVQPAPLKTTSRTLSQIINAVSSLTNAATYSKTFAEIVKAIGSVVNQTGRTFVESLNTVSVLTNVLSAIKTLTESLVIVPVYAGILTAYKVLTEVVKTTGSILNQTARTLTENIKASGIYTGVLSAAKILTEAIVVGANAIFNASRTLIEVLVVSPVYSTVLTAERVFVEVVKVIGTIARETGRVLTEVFNVLDPLMDYLVVISKIYTEVVKAGDLAVEKVFTGFKILVEQIRVAVSFLSAGVFYRVFSEVVIVAGAVTRQTGRVFTEIVNVISNRIGEVARLFTETLAAAGGLTNQTGKVLGEALNVSAQFIRDIVHTFIEAINVVANQTSETAKLFTENVVIAVVFNSQRMRILAESIVVAGQALFLATVTFVETIIITWQKLTYRAFSYTESLVVRVVFMPFTIGKLLIERVVGTTEWLFEKTQFIELTDSLRVGVSFVKSTTRLFIETVKLASDVIIRYLGRTFEETVYVAKKNGEYLNLLYGRVLGEAVSITGALGEWVIGKVLPEVVQVYHSIAKASAWLMSETISVVGNMVLSTGKLLVETISVISDKVVDFGRVLIQTIKVFDATRFKKTQYKILTDIVKASSSLVRAPGKVLKESFVVVGSVFFAASRLFIEQIKVVVSLIAGGTFYKVLSEGISVVGNAFNQAGKIFLEGVAMVGSFVLGTISKLLTEVVKVYDNIANVWTLGRLFSEAVSVSGNAISQSIKIFTEAVAVSGEFILGTISKVLIEVVSIYETITKSLPKVFEETVAVVSNTYNQGAKIFTETISVVGTFVLGTISKLLTETVTVVAEFITGSTFYKVLSEVVVVVGNGINQSIKVFSEVVSVVGEFVLGTISKVLTEVVKVYGTINSAITRVFTEVIEVVVDWNYIASNIFSETIKIVGTMSGLAIGKLLKEVVKVGSSFVKTTSRTFTQVVVVAGTITRYLSGRVFAEHPAVNSAITKLTGRIFTQTVVAHWAKIKLVLNGIQVGLWKKIARVTTGAWVKISRNDN